MGAIGGILENYLSERTDGTERLGPMVQEKIRRWPELVYLKNGLAVT